MNLEAYSEVPGDLEVVISSRKLGNIVGLLYLVKLCSVHTLPGESGQK